MSKKASGNVQKTTENANQSVDTQTRDYLSEMQNAARRAGAAGPSPLVSNATGYYGTAQANGMTGMNALGGDAQAAQRLMNPYQQQVIDANNAQWAHTNAGTMNQVNDAATRANAFGGSRHGVATGVALANNNLAQQAQTAGLLNQGFTDTMNRANSLAGLGFAGANANANLGMGGVGNPDQWLLQQLRQGFVMPTGGTSGGAQTTQGGSTSGGFKIPFFGNS